MRKPDRRPISGTAPSARIRPALAAGAVTASALLLAGLAGCGGPPASSNHRTASTTPASLLPRLDRAIAEENRGDDEKAVADFLAVVKADRKDSVAWYDLGVIAARNGQETGAIRDYRAALGGDPTYVPALYNLGVLEAPTHPKDAVTLYDKVVRIRPGDADARLNLGFALLALDEGTQGRAQLAKAIRLDPALASRVPVADGGTG